MAEEMEKRSEAICALETELNITYTSWGMDEPSIEAFWEPHPYGEIKEIIVKGHPRGCCFPKRTMNVSQAKSWIQLWLVIEGLREGHRCDHLFIEDLTVQDGVLSVGFGS